MKLEQWLSKLTTWELIKLVLTLGFVAGVLAGLSVGMFYEQTRITTTLNDIAWQQLNIFRIDDKAYIIEPITIECYPKLITYRGVPCVLTNMQDQTQTVIWKIQ